ncbi:C4 aminotransferase specific for PseB product (PseC, second step of pseudaminic acid biosynthesis) [hydrothermal vent metagenome]|uniref:C4 aminotransferase specific for PseB product (PseC, second step of pseudaminic acid biosynthesis) n=1 Tax=hydrothermal vent metagenome TaxID=652676 RepID=A0A1W1BHT4_9ZZZZ
MIPYSTQLIEQDDIDAVVEVLQSSHLAQGERVAELEKSISEYIDIKHTIMFNSATSALFALYNCYDIKEGDEIITTPISFVATTNMFVTLGAKPIWCDVKLDGNIDEKQIEKLITPKTRAIVAVDFGGKPVEHKAIAAIAKKHNLLYIDDACHAFGSDIEGKKVGTFADATVFSFHAIKPFTTGEGGCVVTNDDKLAQKLRLFCSHGVVKKQFWNADMVQMGFNFRLTELQAALGLSQIKKVNHFIQKRNEIAAYYDERFKNHKLFMTQKIATDQKSARHLYPLILDPALHCPKEDIFIELQEKGIGVQVHYKPIYQNSYYKELFGETSLLVANDFYRSELSIPCHQKMSLEDAKKVADIVLKVLEKYSYRGCSF